MTVMTTLMPAALAYGKAAGTKTEKVLTDGTVFYCGTPECGYTSDAFQSVFAHLTAHSTKRRKNGAARTEQVKALKGLREQVNGLVKTLDSFESGPTGTVSEEKFETMRQRALTAERKLASMRRALS